MQHDWLTQDQLVLASNNAGKIAELQQIFSTLNLPIQVVPQKQFEIPDAVEDGLSFIENAILKARHAAQLSGKPALADDSGLCVPILNGAPGIYSARYAGEHGNDALNNQKLLDDLKPYRSGTPTIQGYFVCVLALVRHQDDPLPLVYQGIWQGEILEQPRGSAGFGYDPLFWLPELGKSSAELDKAEKNKISHRGQAMQLFKQSLI
ncbi:non-canonical purine NTP pyrophosphatase, RdgB/HAM1 family [Alkanindiges hydrocarboniclasticus]|jgi:XTP/dITP diphosphohydrolase|uniref:dITP/XTP pyrophosphatase n=1 Tax=Alkanindiges hydrocarboniclasticus TaxID=1907941 RepID=A0A1S8CY65_9GAMM|nr:RdgB/HAM1 family non-canonical purine NTP pyrophosphatase [Alkanindiges hydrocarboniclasticus]ONG41533.1 non-canonical purine NTP pyrophosphatase, RdgB/HAM1 family [Alkanindiges hydrocarboniclasticus]